MEGDELDTLITLECFKALLDGLPLPLGKLLGVFAVDDGDRVRYGLPCLACTRRAEQYGVERERGVGFRILGTRDPSCRLGLPVKRSIQSKETL